MTTDSTADLKCEKRGARLVLEVCFYGLLLLQVTRIWTFRYYPSQDGPSHLYNAAVMANYENTPVFRDFYCVHVSAAGNLLVQMLQWGLLKTCGEYAAEKVVLSLYAVLLPLSFRLLLATVTGGRGPFILLGLVILPNFFFFMGFWNFCLSIPLLFFAIVWFRSRHGVWSPASIVGLTLLSFLTYSAHLLSWAVLAMVIALESGVALVRAWKAHEPGGAFRNIAAGMTAASLPALLALAYLRSAGGLVHGGTLRDRTWPLYSTSFLRGLSVSDRWLSIGFTGMVVALALGALFHRWHDRRLRGPDIFLLFALACAAMSVWSPGTAASAYVSERFSLYAWTFGAVWLAANPWPSWIRLVTGVAIAGLAIAGVALHLPAEAEWNRRLGEYVSARRFIAPGSTILAIQMETRHPDPDPMLHAVGLVALDGAIDLRNYEASLRPFLVQFRPNRTPANRLGNPTELEVVQPKFDISGYQAATGRHVDYLLVYGGTGAPELRCYAAQIAGYRPVYTSRPGRVRLYERDVQRDSN